MSDAPRFPWLNLWASASVAFVAVLAFTPALLNELVMDDVAQVAELRRSAGISDWLKSAAEPWWKPEKRKYLWRPVTRMAISAEKSLASEFGDENSPMMYHAFSILFHAFNSVLVFWLAWELGFSGSSSFAAALILAVHPLRSEAVHQVVGQAEILASIFMLGGLLAHLRARRAGLAWPKVIAIQILFYTLALGSKEHAALYPVYFLLLETVRFIRREKSTGLFFVTKERIFLLGSLMFVFFAFLAGKYAVTGGVIEPRNEIPPFENVLAGMNFFRRLPAVAGIFAYALEKAIVPVALSPDYSAQSLPLEKGWLWPMSWIGIAIAVALIGYCAHNFRRGGRGWALAIAGLAAYGLTSNLLFPIGVSLALRLWYFPMTAFALGLGWLIGLAFDHSGQKRARFIYNVSCITLILWLQATWNFAPAWRSNADDASATLARFPQCWRAHHNLARECYGAKDFSNGLDHARIAVQLRPDEATSWDVLGLNAMFIPGREAEAEAAFKKAIELQANLPLSFQHLGNLYFMQGKLQDARPYLEQYLATSPADRETVQAKLDRIRSATGK